MPLNPTTHKQATSIIRTMVVPKMAVCILLAVWLASYTGCKKEDSSSSTQQNNSINKSFTNDPLTVDLITDKATLDIAQTLTLQLTAKIDDSWSVIFPDMPATLAKDDHWSILDVDSLPEKLGDNNQIIQTRKYRLEPLADGELTLPELAFTYQKKKANSDSQNQLKTTPIIINVTTTIGDLSESPKIDDIKGVVELPIQWWGWWPSWLRWAWWVWTIIGGGVALLVALAIILRSYKRPKKIIRVYRPAHEIAQERLQKLIAENLIADKKIKEFYQRISHILRLYIEHRFDLRAPERTTEEFFQETASTDALNAEQKEKLGDFLNHCDLVKFARYGPTETEIQKTIDITQDFIETTKVEEKQVEITNK